MIIKSVLFSAFPFYHFICCSDYNFAWLEMLDCQFWRHANCKYSREHAGRRSVLFYRCALSRRPTPGPGHSTICIIYLLLFVPRHEPSTPRCLLSLSLMTISHLTSERRYMVLLHLSVLVSRPQSHADQRRTCPRRNRALHDTSSTLSAVLLSFKSYLSDDE